MTASSSQFLGWQKTPIHQASFGRTTKGGYQNTKFYIKHTTGSVKIFEPKWYLVDASKFPLGRWGTVVATLLMGKHRSIFSRGAGSGDFVAVINADKAYFTSNKAQKKIYYWHSHHMGGLKNQTAEEALNKHPEVVILDMVQGMMPKTALSRHQLTHLKVYCGKDHPHAAQKLTVVDIEKKGLKEIEV